MTNSMVTDGSNHKWPVAVAISLAIVALGAATVGCGSSSQIPDETLAGPAGEDDAFWRDWTPREPAAMPVDDQLEPATVFDAWLVGDPEYQDPAWDGLFHGLTTFNAALDDETASSGVESLMMRLDPEAGNPIWELAFLSQADGRAEGIVLRIVRSDGSGLLIEGMRSSGDADRPGRWTARLEPAVEEVDGVTVRLEPGDDGWSAHWARGADATETDRSLETEVDWDEIVDIWESALWEPVTQTRYLDTNFEYINSPGQTLAGGWPASLDRDVEERQLEDFVTDTVFPPGGDPEFDPDRGDAEK